MKKTVKRFLFIALPLCCILAVAWLCVAPMIRVNMLPRASREEGRKASPLGSLPYNWYEKVIESYEHPEVTKTNHFLKVRFVSAESRQVRRSHDNKERRFVDDADDFDDLRHLKDFKADLITLEVLDNLSDSDIEPGTQITLYVHYTRQMIPCFKDKDAVYLSIPSFLDLHVEDDIINIEGKDYYGSPVKEELFFLLDGKIYPYRDITYEEMYDFNYRVKGVGNPYAKYRGMTEEAFREAILPILKNPRY